MLDGVRSRKMTSKGTQYRLDQLKNSYRQHKRKWRTHLNSIASLVVTESNADVLKNHCIQLDSKMKELVQAYEQLEKALDSEEDRNALDEDFDAITSENLDLLKMVKEKIKELEERESSISSSASSRSSRSYHTQSSYKSSNAPSTKSQHRSSKLQKPRNKKTTNYQGSIPDSKSSLHERQLDLRSRINTLNSKLETTAERQRIEIEAQARLEEIHKQKLQLQLNEERIKHDLKFQTDKIKAEEDLMATKAELESSCVGLSSDKAESSLHSLDDSDYSKELLHRYLDQAKHYTYTEPGGNAGNRFQQPPSFKLINSHDPRPLRRSNGSFVDRRCHSSSKLSKFQDSESSVSENESPATRESLVERQLVDIVKTLVDNQRHFNLPSPEPGIFNGDSLQFPTWIQAFETLIESKTTRPSEKIHYLRKYVSGEAKEAIDGLLILNSNDAYEMAKEVLVKRFGDPFAVANAYRQKLDLWPKIPNGDAKALRKFADFLVHCEKAMVGTTSLNVLNDDLENRKLAVKLPRWLIARWTRDAYQYKEENGLFPPFKKFVKFVTKESDIANDPVFSSQVPDAPTSKKPKEFSKGIKTAGSFSTTAENSLVETDLKKVQSSCSLCKSSSHHLERCEEFLKKNVDERKKYAQNNSLCFGCLNYGHLSKACQERKTCEICNRQHPTPLHGDIRGKPKADKDSKDNVPQATSNCTKTMNRRLCKTTYSMIVPVWISHADNPQFKKLVYALLDDQSYTTFVTDKVLEDLGVRGVKTRLSLSTLHAENKIVNTRKVKNLAVQDFKCQVSITLPRSFTRSSIPVQRSQIPTPESAKLWAHTQPIAKELMPYNKDIEVGILIGLDCTRALIPREVIPGDDGTPYALKTDLGWGIVGRYNNNPDDLEEDEIGVSHTLLSYEVENPPASCHLAFKTAVKEKIDPEQVYKMFNLDFSEVNVEKESLSYEEKIFLRKMDDGIVLRPDGHYQMPLPFKDTDQRLPNNRGMALHRLKGLKKRMLYDEHYHQLYNKSMDDVISKGFAEKVPQSQMTTEPGKVWYIPHHGVFHPKKPDKLRVVYDCSAKYKGESLNDHLLAGPDLTNNLVGVLCRFRQEPYAFIGDIEGMFHQFKVEKRQRDFLRFLWWDEGNFKEDPTEYRMTVHLFGARSSPACANYGLKKVANDNEDEFGPDVANLVRKNFYVDDGLKSLPTEDEAITMIQKSQQMCARGGLRLHKFTSNSRKVVESIPVEDRAKDLKEFDLQHNSLPVERVLGIQWCVENDAFQFRIVIQDKPLTRRGILSTLCSIYDPLGFIAPVILTGKQILQELTKDKVDWDEPVPEPMKARWEKWKVTLPSLESLHIQRCYKPNDFGNVKSVELHHFSDASSYGYGQCSYIRLVNHEDQVHCALVLGKARVCPLKSITIPRLELTAALLSVKISSTLNQELEVDISQANQYFWTDSCIVLGYINNDSRRFHVFVANRVQQIRDQTSPSQWRPVKSKENPADHASRGLYALQLATSSWIRGPQFLWQPDHLQQDSAESLITDTISEDDPEVKRSHVLVTETFEVKMATLLQRLKYFSDWFRAKRAIALCVKFMQYLQKPQSKHQVQSVAVDDLALAEEIIIKAVQKDAFATEIRIINSLSNHKISDDKSKKSLAKKSSLYRLDPLIDEHGILRVGGRIRCSDLSYHMKHPIILPRNGHITMLLVRHHHEKTKHQGRGMTLNELRNSGYWIIGGSSAVGRQINSCVVCRKLRRKTETQKMSDLPSDRLDAEPPFTFCAVDVFGPWYVKEGRKELKRYGVLFTCMACRAIHLETANSMDTSSFINALRRFISRRGPIRQLRCDRGTNFVGAKRELQQAVERLDETKIQDFLLQKNCDFFTFAMNVPSASHMGGSWERQIRTVRSVLSALLEEHGHQLDDESLRTLMCEAESVVNSRPLTVDNLCSPTSPEPLTPNHLLTGKTQVVLPPPTEFQQPDLYSRRRWRRVQYLTNQFWSRWRKEFVLSLQQRQKWIRPRRNLEINDIVLIKTD